MAMGLSSKKVLAIEWDPRSIRMVLARPKADGVELLKAVSVPMAEGVSVDEAERLGGFIKESISKSRIGVNRAILAIPRDQVVLNTLRLPPTPAEELAAIVQFQVTKELPFAAEQAVLDFAVAGEHDPKQPCSVLATAIRREQLEFYQKVASSAGLSIERVGLRPLANLTAVTASTGETGRELVLVVDVGPHRTEIDLIRGGELVFSRAASMSVGNGAAEPAAGGAVEAGGYTDSRIVAPVVPEPDAGEAQQQAVAALLVEVIRSFEAFRATEPSASVDRIVVAGSSGLEPQLAQMAGARFAARAELFNPEKALGLPAERARELRGFSATLGLAIGHSQDTLSLVDFLHPKRPVTRRELRLKKVPSAVMAAVLLLGSLYMIHAKYVSPLREEVRELQRTQSTLKAEEKVVRAFAEKVDALEGWMESEQHWPIVLAEVSELFPPEREAFVTRLDLETLTSSKGLRRESTAKLRFRTASLGTVNELAEKLRRGGYMDVVAGKETPAGGRDVYRNDTGIELGVPLRRFEAAAGGEAGENPTAKRQAEGEISPSLENGAESPANRQVEGEGAPSSENSAESPAKRQDGDEAPAAPAAGAAGRARLPTASRPAGRGGRR